MVLSEHYYQCPMHTCRHDLACQLIDDTLQKKIVYLKNECFIIDVHHV